MVLELLILAHAEGMLHKGELCYLCVGKPLGGKLADGALQVDLLSVDLCKHLKSADGLAP